MHTLFEDLRSEQNLFAAWRHVKRSALNSKNNEIKGYAAKFEHQHEDIFIGSPANTVRGASNSMM